MTWLRSKFFQAVLVLVIVFVLFRFGIRPPAPWSVVTLYMTIVLIAVFVYVSSDSDSWRNFLAPIHSTLVDDSKRPIRFALMVLIPLVFGYYAYTQAAAQIPAPSPCCKKPTCSGGSPRAGRACRRSPNPGTLSCRRGRTGSPRRTSGR